MENQEAISCENCGEQLKGTVCHQCGQPSLTKRWSTRILLKQFANQITDIEKGFFYTSKTLFTFPGRLIQDYWRGKTIFYYNPFRYMLIWTAINLLINFWLGIDDMLQASMQPDSLNEDYGEERMQAVDRQFDSWLNFLVLLLIPTISLVSYWLFKKKKKNYAEHLIMNSYIFGQQALIHSFTQFVFFFFPALFSGYFIFYFLVGLVYNTFVFSKTFNESLWVVILKALVVGIAGMLTLFALIFLFSAVILLI